MPKCGQKTSAAGSGRYLSIANVAIAALPRFSELTLRKRLDCLIARGQKVVCRKQRVKTYKHYGVTTDSRCPNGPALFTRLGEMKNSLNKKSRVTGRTKDQPSFQRQASCKCAGYQLHQDTSALSCCRNSRRAQSSVLRVSGDLSGLLQRSLGRAGKRGRGFQ